MPRCGCSRGLDAIECTCEVTSGDPRISVEGNGTPGISPYVISLTTSGPGVDVEDTDTVDMTISGEDPAVISSEVRLSTDTGNALRKGSDGGLYVALPIDPPGGEDPDDGDYDDGGDDYVDYHTLSVASQHQIGVV
jgi:hypothetical protein